MGAHILGGKLKDAGYRLNVIVEASKNLLDCAKKRLVLLKNQLYLGKKHIYFGQVIL
jgi:hypothetical protein